MKAGVGDAIDFIQSDRCTPWLSWLCLDHADLAVLHQRLVAMLKNVDDVVAAD